MTDDRRYDIDWLRSLAFILLIFYHIAMFYVADWGWHVKSNHLSVGLQDLMILVNQWRMPLIFIISGFALSLVEPKINGLQLFKIRFLRIFVPLVIGMYLIVPPQLYYQLMQNEGFNASYATFMSFYIDANTAQFPQHQHGPLGLLTWNHLWYLAYLWHYTLAYLMLRPLLNKINWQHINIRFPALSILFIPTLLLVCYGLLLKPIFPKTHALFDDWYNHALYFTIFMLGYLLPKLTIMWQAIADKRRVWLVIAVCCYALIIADRHDWIAPWLVSIGADIEAIEKSYLTRLIIQTIVYLNVICWLYTLIGFARVHLNRKNKFLSYLNEAVLPWYILHQTIIIIVAMNLQSFSLGPVWEPIWVVVLTLLGCAVLYEGIKRTVITRFMFGMKIVSKRAANSHSEGDLSIEATLRSSIRQ